MRGPGPPPEVPTGLHLRAESCPTAVMHEQFICLFERSLYPGVWEASAIKTVVELPDTLIGLANDPPKG